MRAPGRTEPGARKGVPAVPERSLLRAGLVGGDRRGAWNYEKGSVTRGGAGRPSREEQRAVGGGVISGSQVGDPQRRLEGPRR